MGSKEMETEDRVSRTRVEARRNYDRLARWYDLLSGGSEWRFDEEALRLLDPQPGESVLEIGYGTGKALEWIRRRTGRSGKVVGVDLSEGMRNVAASRLQRAGFPDVELRLGDAVDLPFPADSFDAAFLGFTLELFDTPELPRVMQEARRVLRRTGRIAIASLALRRCESVPVRLYLWAHRRFPRAIDCRPIRLERIIEQAGFEPQEHHEGRMWGLPVDVMIARNPLAEP